MIASLEERFRFVCFVMISKEEGIGVRERRGGRVGSVMDWGMGARTVSVWTAYEWTLSWTGSVDGSGWQWVAVGGRVSRCHGTALSGG